MIYKRKIQAWNDNGTYKALKKTQRVYYKLIGEYTTAGTYNYTITDTMDCLIELIGGGGGSAQVDGGVDPYSDTAFSWHYGHNGANGGYFKGIAHLTPGTLSITVGAVGTNNAGKGVTSGNGGDSYAIFTPTGGSAVEIARAGGGHSGYPDSEYFYDSTSGGTVTYNSTYITKVIKSNRGSNSGSVTWTIRI